MVAPPWHQLGKRVGASLLRPASAKLLWFSALSAGAYESDMVTVRQSTITVFAQAFTLQSPYYVAAVSGSWPQLPVPTDMLFICSCSVLVAHTHNLWLAPLLVTPVPNTIALPAC
jgi:hypothetical protein